MEQDGDLIPKPSKNRDIHHEDDETIFMIDVFMTAFRDKMVTFPRWLNDLADKENVNCSQLFQTPLKDYLGADDRRGI
ncbi:MAG: Phage protein [Firmicutes bacterium]|nr:Phage protein [Bacillota bacterium]